MMLNGNVSKMIENFRYEWKTLEGDKTYKVYTFMSVVADSKKKHYKIKLLVNDGKSFGTSLLNGSLERKIIKLHNNKSLLDEAGIKSIHMLSRIGNNVEVVQKSNL